MIILQNVMSTGQRDRFINNEVMFDMYFTPLGQYEVNNDCNEVLRIN